jgi:hypothetical protein
MGIGSEFRKFGRKFEDTSRRAAKYTFAAGGAMMGGSAGAKAGYQIGSMFDDRKPQARQTGTDLGKLRRDAVANGFNPLTVLRATGGQGFYRDQVPMGRLSSDAFFNAFDAYDNYKNKNAPVIEEPKITGKDILAPVKVSNGKLNSDQNTAIYDVVQDPVTYEFVTDGDSVFSAKQKSLDHVWVDPWGKKWRLPTEEMEWGNLILGGFLKTLAGSYHVGDITGKALREKLGKTFGWYGYKAEKKTKGNTIEQLKKLQNQMNYKSGAISQKTLGTIRNLSSEDQKFVDFMKAQF